jgi:hypothetical protein
MYGCFDAYVVYGVADGTRHRLLDRSWLEEHYPEFGTYALDVVRNHIGEACYGVKCVVSRTLGVFDPTEETKKKAQELYEKLVEYDAGENNVRLGFFNVISGDYDKSEHEKYTL